MHVPGVRQWMGAVGWELVEDEFMTLPEAADAAAQLAALEALAQAFAKAKEAERAAELEARSLYLTPYLPTSPHRPNPNPSPSPYPSPNPNPNPNPRRARRKLPTASLRR